LDSSPLDLTPLWLSLQVASVATLIDLGAGLALAYLFAFRRFPLKLVLETALDLPLVLPPTVVGFLLLLLLGPHGPLGRGLEALGVTLLFSLPGAVIASAVMALPLFVRTARAAFEAIPARYLDAGRSLGASELGLLFRVILPLGRRGVAAGLLLCFARALGEFGATLMVAGNIPGRTQTLPLAIYARVFEGRYAEAWLLVGFTIGVSALALSLGRVLGSR
jgi:molybdate transport system permease protein